MSLSISSSSGTVPAATPKNPEQPRQQGLEPAHVNLADTSVSRAPTSAPSSAPDFDLAAALEALQAALTQSQRGGPQGLLLQVPVASPTVLWDAFPEAPAAAWHPPGGEASAAVGAIALFHAHGEDRFASIQAQVEETLQGLPATAIAQRIYGGLAFEPETPEDEVWAPFDAAAFFLPRFAYTRRGQQAQLTLRWKKDDADKQVLGQAQALLQALQLDRPAPPQGIWPALTEELPLREWYKQMARVHAAFGPELRKVVLARETRLHLPVPINPRVVLERLGAEHADCFRFGLRLGGRSFIGASPELLLRRAGQVLEADALAGTAEVPERASPHGELELRAQGLIDSLKDRGEHQIVVEAIEEALRPFCKELSLPSVPAVRRFRHVLHLHTPLHGLLKEKTHLLEVASKLHPTPAVAGAPTRPARALLRDCEGSGRGWYAGPIGHFDAHGEGELSVAIRSGLLHGRVARIWAGAGIVPASDADAEYEETRTKERALRAALGVTL